MLSFFSWQISLLFVWNKRTFAEKIIRAIGIFFGERGKMEAGRPETLNLKLGTLDAQPNLPENQPWIHIPLRCKLSAVWSGSRFVSRSAAESRSLPGKVFRKTI
jgi:hypothetical protein